MLNKTGNTNIWLLMPIGEVSTSYDNNYGMGKIDVSFEYVQVGDANNEDDLRNTGMIEEIIDLSSLVNDNN